jgi:hypothetical protein
MGVRGERAGLRGERRQVRLPGLNCLLQFPFFFSFLNLLKLKSI